MLLTDALSRCPSRASGEIKLDMRVDYIAFSKTWIAKLKDTTREDPILGTVYQLTQQGWPHQRRHTPRMARAYWNFRDQLSTDEGLLLMGPRIVIPSCLQEEYLQRLHQGHLSATKVQQNAPQHLYWPGLDAGHSRLHKEMPGMHMPISASQRATASSRGATRALGENRHGLLLHEWQVVYLDL